MIRMVRPPLPFIDPLKEVEQVKARIERRRQPIRPPKSFAALRAESFLQFCQRVADQIEKGPPCTP
jgi:hypothetical protein